MPIFFCKKISATYQVAQVNLNKLIDNLYTHHEKTIKTTHRRDHISIITHMLHKKDKDNVSNYR